MYESHKNKIDSKSGFFFLFKDMIALEADAPSSLASRTVYEFIRFYFGL